MTRHGLQFSIAAMIGLIACLAFNLWLFRVSFLYGLVGLNVTKHVGVAILCQAIGVNRRVIDDNEEISMPKSHASFKGSP